MSKPAQKTRMVFKAEIDPTTARRFTEMCEETGISQINITSRLVHWFSRQDEATQLCVLGVLGRDQKIDVAREYLERIARDGLKAV